jgi:hypothetical protein
MAQPRTITRCPQCGRIHPEPLLHKIFGDHRWTLGALIIIAVMTFFFWAVFNHEGFVTAINTFASALTTIAAVLVVLGIGVMWVRYALSPKKKGSH